MERIRKYIYICAFFFFCAALQVNAQSKKVQNLQAQSKKTKKEIEQTSKLIKETEKSKQFSLQRLELINQQITLRQTYVQNLESEINGLERGIVTADAQIRTLQAQYKQMQKEYNLILFTMYKLRDSYDQLVFIFSSESINQGFNRIKYLQYYSDHLIKQAQKIKLFQDSLHGHINYQNAMLKKKNTLVTVQVQEKEELHKNKTQEAQIVQELTTKQKELKKKLDEKKALAKKFDRQIEDIIRAEMEAERKRKLEEERKRKEAEAKKAAEAKAAAAKSAATNSTAATSTTTAKPTTTTAAKTTTTKTTASPVTPAVEESALSKNFFDNKGKLPWPTSNGRITERFGTHPHPTLPIDVECNGVEITVSKGTKAKAVFEGTVAKIVIIPGKNTAVLIKHGNYYTVYDNLINVTVKPGQKVFVNQELGTVFTDPETGATIIQLQIWKDLVKLDPEPWLKK